MARADRVHLDSHLKDRDIVIDGDIGEWPGPFVPIDEQHPVAVAVVNDGEYLYLALTASDAAIRRQIMGQGLIVWFDPEGKDKKHYGIKFPVGISPADRGRGARGMRGQPGDQDEPARPSAPPAFEEPAARLEILGPKKDDAHSFVIDRAPGVTAKLAQVGRLARVRVEGAVERVARTCPTPSARRQARRLASASKRRNSSVPRWRAGAAAGWADSAVAAWAGAAAVGMGGRGGGMGGRGGEGRGRIEPAKPMKIWATVRLAS